jgi:DNA-binding transcriptional LysR family regulator
MTLKQIEAFYWAAKLGSFAIAAQRLHVTQSSLSKRVAELEESVGALLFDRTSKRAQLSEAGQRLLGHAARMLELSETMRSEAGTAKGLIGTCRFGITELGSLTWLPAFIRSARQLHPGLLFQPYVDLARLMERCVTRGELDFAVAPGPAQDDEISSHKICEVECTWMASPTRIAPGKVLTPKQLEGQPVITMTEGSGMTLTINQWALEQGIRLQRTLASNSLMAIIGLTAADIGISYLPSVFMQPWIAQDRLIAFRSEPHPPHLSYYFLHRSDDKRDMIPAMKQLVASAADYAIAGEPETASHRTRFRKRLSKKSH